MKRVIVILLATMMCIGASGRDMNKDIDKARRLYQAGEFEKACKMAAQIVEDHPKEIDAWMLWGDVQPWTALEALNRVLDTEGLTEDDLFYFLGTRARLYHNAGAYHEAILDLQRLKKMAPDTVVNGFIAEQSAATNYASYHFKEAAEDLTDLMHYFYDAFLPDYLYFRGRCYENAGLFDMALRDYTSIVEKPDVNEYQALAYLHRGNIEEIRQLYEAALKDYNNGIISDDREMGLYLCRGRLLLEHYKDTLNANMDFEYILRKTKNGQSTIRPFALMYLGRKDEALASLDQCMPEDPSASEFYIMASLYSRLGMTDKALNCLESSLNLGFRAMELIDHDPDMDPLRDNERFQDVVDLYKMIRSEENIGFYEEDDEPDVDVDMKE